MIVSLCMMMHVQSLRLEVSTFTDQSVHFLCVHRKYDFKRWGLKAAFVTSHIVWKPILDQSSVSICNDDLLKTEYGPHCEVGDSCILCFLNEGEAVGSI